MATARSTQAHDRFGDEALGFALGFLGVLGFSFSLPMTRLAVPDFGPTVTALGRSLGGGVLAALLLLVLREPLPARRYWPAFGRIALGVLVGFPILTSIALRHLPAAHSAVVVGLLPAATAVSAVLRAGERPPRAFWLAVLLGVTAVLAFATAQGAGKPQRDDLLLLLAVGAAAFGYTEGALIARELGGWRVTCWTLVLAAPVLAIPVGVAVARHGLQAEAKAWGGLIYLSAISVFVAFFAWYRGLTLGGVARVGQMQLVQPVLTLVWSMLLLGERIGLWTILASLAVIASVGLTRRAWSTRRRPSAAGSRLGDEPPATAD